MTVTINNLKFPVYDEVLKQGEIRVCEFSIKVGSESIALWL